MKLTKAERALQAWQAAHQLTEDETRDTILAVWPQMFRGIQQREAGKVSTPKKAAAVRANGAKGGRPRKAV